MLPGIACGKGARSSAQGIDFQPGVICHCRQPRVSGDLDSLFHGIGFAGLAVFHHLRRLRKIIEGPNGDMQVAQEGNEFLLLVLIPGRQHYVHR